MFIQFLGTGAGSPTLFRNVSSIALIMDVPKYEVWLFDCGEATQHQILKSCFKLTKIKKIFITHLHADHILGLPGLLSTISINHYNNLLEIYGPKGIKSFIYNIFKITNSFINYNIKIYEINEGKIFNNNILEVNSFSLNHNLECYGFYIKIFKKRGKLNIDKLRKEGINPGPIYKIIKYSKQNFFFNNKLIKYKKYLNKSIKSKKIFILGDSAPLTMYSKHLLKADLLIHESTLRHNFMSIANKRGHSTNIQAANLAYNYKVKKLILTHFSARYTSKDFKSLLYDCIKIFTNTFIAYDLYILKI